MEIRSKEFAVRAEAAETSDEDLALINERFALTPLERDQVYVRRLALCNDRYDRTQERFPRSYLERFAETLPGKPLLAHHNRTQFPLGRFFRAEVSAAPDADGATWLHCWTYLVKTPANEEVRTQIDAGIYSHVSVGFRWADLHCDLCGKSYFRGDCPHVIGQEYDGTRCTATYAGDLRQVEAVEGSLVYLGAQYGAVVTKSSDRRAEKQSLARAAAPEPKPAPDIGPLEAEGRQYREDLRAEILRVAGCVGSGREATTLLQALGDVPVPRLKEVLADYQVRFDGLFPPAAPAAAPARRSDVGRLQLGLIP